MRTVSCTYCIGTMLSPDASCLGLNRVSAQTDIGSARSRVSTRTDTRSPYIGFFFIVSLYVSDVLNVTISRYEYITGIDRFSLVLVAFSSAFRFSHVNLQSLTRKFRCE